MLRPSKDLQDRAIFARVDATHDARGDVKDLFFDDEAWAIRHLVVSKPHARAGCWSGAASAKASASDRAVSSRAA